MVAGHFDLDTNDSAINKIGKVLETCAVHEGHRRRFEGEQGGAEHLDAADAEQQTIKFLLILTGRAIDLCAHQQNCAKTDHCLSEREDRMGVVLESEEQLQSCTSAENRTVSVVERQ